MQKIFSGAVVVLLLAVVIIAGVFVYMALNQQNEVGRISSFEECKAAWYPIMESYPEQCKTPDGRTFTNTPIVQPYSPSFGTPTKFTLNQKIIFEDGLQVILKEINDSRCKEGVVCVWAGELGYIFEVTGGNFKEIVYKLNLGTAQAREKQAQGYTFSLEIGSATETAATIVITKSKVVTGNCYVGGCSGQICSDQKDIITTCEYKEEYACYKNAVCIRQADGKCGWTQTAELKACLESNK